MARGRLAFLVMPLLLVSWCAAQDSIPKKSDEPRRPDAAAPAEKKSLLADDRENPSTIPSVGKIWVSPEKHKELEDRHQKLREQFAALERQLKKEKLLPSACKLSGKLDGDTIAMRAEILFSTTAPQSVVFLGLKNGFLIDEGQHDDGVPHLEAGEDGFSVRAEKVGMHRLTLNLRVPVVAKRQANSSTGAERGFELGLPGSAVTTLSLELPGQIKDVRWNENTIVLGASGKWNATLGSQRNLAVVWKDPTIAATGNLQSSARANLKVKIEEGRVEIAGEMILEDGKNLQREWQLLLPGQVKISPAAGSTAFTVTPPDGKSNAYLIRVAEPSDKITLSIQSQYVRTLTQQKLPIGPILAQGVPMQGTILIQAAPGALRGQRLTYHRFGEIFQRDPPKSPVGFENLAMFQFWNAPFSGKGLSPAKSALELEWKTERGQVEAVTEHDVRMRENHDHWLVDVETRFAVASVNSGIDTLELLVPVSALPEALWLATQPGIGFPATLRWPVALAPRSAIPLTWSVLDDVGAVDLSAIDAQHRVRLKLNRPIGKELIVKVQSRMFGVGDARRFSIEFPRLIGVADRGAKVTVLTPPEQEFQAGPANQTERFHDRYQKSFEQMPASLELSWRNSRRERLARTVADVSVRENMAHVRQTISLPSAAWSGTATQTGQIALRLPSPGFAFSALNVTRLGYDASLAWVKLPAESKGDYEIQCEYDVPLVGKNDDGAISIPLLWPDDATQLEAKLRIWTRPGISPKIVDPGEIWRQRPLEEGRHADSWPALVASGIGTVLPLAIKLEQSAGARLPVLVTDRSLFQVRIDGEANQSYRCRYLVRKFGDSFVDIELPVSWDQGQPRFRIDGKDIGGVSVIDPNRHRVRLPLAPELYATPVLLEIEYQIPAGLAGGNWYWQTPLLPPRFEGEVVYGPTRWQAKLPGNQVAMLFGAAAADYRWTINGWLFSAEPATTAADLASWIGGGEVGEIDPVGLSWWRTGVERQHVYHFPRPFWLATCSGLVLGLGLLAMLTPMPRYLLGLGAISFALGLLALGLFHESAVPALFLGCQPGLVVLLVVSTALWLIHARQARRRTVMPSFSRAPLGSTLIRGQGKPPRDPSTIDAPPVGEPVNGSKH